jgi:hypothetical protein
MRYAPTMRWKFTHDTVEDLTANTLHRPGCDELEPETPVETHPSGSAVARDVAPRQCWTCRPDIEMVLGI